MTPQQVQSLKVGDWFLCDDDYYEIKDIYGLFGEKAYEVKRYELGIDGNLTPTAGFEIWLNEDLICLRAENVKKGGVEI